MAEANASAGTGFSGILDIAKFLGPMVFGSGTTKSTETKMADPATVGSNSQLFAALGLEAADAEGTTKGIVDRIIEKAAIAFAPIVGEQNKAGLYNSTVIKQLSAQAGAAASKEAAAAVLDYKTNAQKLQAAIGGNLLNATSTSTKTSTVAPTIKPGISGLITAALAAKSAQKWFEDAKKVPTSAANLRGTSDVRAEESYNPDIPTDATSSTLSSGETVTSSAGGSPLEVSDAISSTVDANTAGIVEAVNFGDGGGEALDLATSDLVADTGVADAVTTGSEAYDVSGEALNDLQGGDAVGDELAAGAVGAGAFEGVTVGAGIEGLAAGDAFAGIAGSAGLEAGVGALAGEAGIAELAPLFLAWVICTELSYRGILSPALYAAGSARVKTLSPSVIRGYHLWAIPYTRWMRKYSFATKLITPFALARARHIAGSKNFLGWLSVKVGEPLCWILGKLVSTVEDYNTLYIKGCENGSSR